MHEWVKCADTGYGFGAFGGALEASSKTILTTGGSVRRVVWEGGDDWDGEASVWFLLERREALSLFPPLKTCSASKAWEDAGHTGLPPRHTVVLGSLNGQFGFPSVRRHLLKG